MKTLITLIFLPLLFLTVDTADARPLDVFPGTCKYKKKDRCIVGHRTFKNREWVPAKKDEIQLL